MTITSETQQVSVWAEAGGNGMEDPVLLNLWTFALCTLHPAPFILALLHDTSLLSFLSELSSALVLQRSLHSLTLLSWLTRILMHNRQLRSQPPLLGKHSLFGCLCVRDP